MNPSETIDESMLPQQTIEQPVESPIVPEESTATSPLNTEPLQSPEIKSLPNINEIELNNDLEKELITSKVAIIVKENNVMKNDAGLAYNITFSNKNVSMPTATIQSDMVATEVAIIEVEKDENLVIETKMANLNGIEYKAKSAEMSLSSSGNENVMKSKESFFAKKNGAQPSLSKLASDINKAKKASQPQLVKKSTESIKKLASSNKSINVQKSTNLKKSISSDEENGVKSFKKGAKNPIKSLQKVRQQANKFKDSSDEETIKKKRLKSKEYSKLNQSFGSRKLFGSKKSLSTEKEKNNSLDEPKSTTAHHLVKEEFHGLRSAPPKELELPIEEPEIPKQKQKSIPKRTKLGYYETQNNPIEYAFPRSDSNDTVIRSPAEPNLYSEDLNYEKSVINTRQKLFSRELFHTDPFISKESTAIPKKVVKKLSNLKEVRKPIRKTVEKEKYEAILISPTPKRHSTLKSVGDSVFSLTEGPFSVTVMPEIPPNNEYAATLPQNVSDSIVSSEPLFQRQKPEYAANLSAPEVNAIISNINSAPVITPSLGIRPIQQTVFATDTSSNSSGVPQMQISIFQNSASSSKQERLITESRKTPAVFPAINEVDTSSKKPLNQRFTELEKLSKTSNAPPQKQTSSLSISQPVNPALRSTSNTRGSTRNGIPEIYNRKPSAVPAPEVKKTSIVLPQNEFNVSERSMHELEEHLGSLSSDVQRALEHKNQLIQVNQELKATILELQGALYLERDSSLKMAHLRPLGGVSRGVTRQAMSKVPTSVQANLNLRNQHKKQIEIERAKYEFLYHENRNLAGKIKTLEFQLTKKGMSLDQKMHKTNESLYWKNKFKDLEKENFKLNETLRSNVKLLEREAKTNNILQKKIQSINTHYTHIPAASFEVEDQFNEYELSDFKSIKHGRTASNLPVRINKKSNLKRSMSEGVAVAKESMLKSLRSNRSVEFSKMYNFFKLDLTFDSHIPNNYPVLPIPLAKIQAESLLTQSQIDQSPLKTEQNSYNGNLEVEKVHSMINKIQNDAHLLIEDSLKVTDERLRQAKVQVEYDVWVGSKVDSATILE